MILIWCLNGRSCSLHGLRCDCKTAVLGNFSVLIFRRVGVLTPLLLTYLRIYTLPMQMSVPLKETPTTGGQLAADTCLTVNNSSKVCPASIPPSQDLLTSCQAVPLPVTSAIGDWTLSTLVLKTRFTTQDSIFVAGVRWMERSVVCWLTSVVTTVTTLLQSLPSTGPSVVVVVVGPCVDGLGVVVAAEVEELPLLPPQMFCPSMSAATRFGRVPDAKWDWMWRSNWAPGVKSPSQARLTRWNVKLSVVDTVA